MTRVERLWPGETVAILGGGPSLTRADVDALRGVCRVIAINKAYELAPWADVMYAADAKFWNWEHGAPAFTGPKYAIEASDPIMWPDVQVLRNTGVTGLELEPTGLRTGYNSGYQSVGLAYHFGAARILLLGFDLKVGANGLSHWHGDHPDRQPSPYGAMLEAFPSIAQPLKDAGVEVINCTPGSALKCFPMSTLRDELARVERAA